MQKAELSREGSSGQRQEPTGRMIHERELWFDSKGNGKAGIRGRFIASQIYSGCLVERRFGEI